MPIDVYCVAAATKKEPDHKGRAPVHRAWGALGNDSVFRQNRSGSAPVEVIVHARADRMEARAVVDVVEAPTRVERPEPAVVAVAAADLRIEILGLDRPVRHEHPLGAAAGGPARLHGAVLVQPAVALHFAISEAARAVDKHRWREQPTETAAHRAEPVEARRGDRREAEQPAQVVVVAARADARALEVGFGAHDEGRPELVVVADLTAANDAAATAAAAIVPTPTLVGRIVGVEAAAEVKTGVEASPQRRRGRRGNVNRRRLMGRKVGGERGADAQSGQRNSRDQCNFLHDTAFARFQPLKPGLGGPKASREEMFAPSTLHSFFWVFKARKRLLG